LEQPTPCNCWKQYAECNNGLREIEDMVKQERAQAWKTFAHDEPCQHCGSYSHPTICCAHQL
jgi:hypothetical protein